VAGFANLVVLDLECSDPWVQAEFYRRLLGWEVTPHHDDYVEITDGSTRILFTRLDGYRGPGWPVTPGTPKRYHLCLQADDMAEAVEQCLAIGAAKPDFQPGGARWTVLTDPAGHPFCIAQRPEA